MSEEPMTDVKRYAPYRMLTREEGPHMFETMHGDWVRASDYDAIKRERDELKHERIQSDAVFFSKVAENERLVEALKQIRDDTILDRQDTNYYKRIILVHINWCKEALTKAWQT